MAEKNMNAKISVEFEETANRQQLSSGDNLPTLFGKIKKIISDLSTSAFSGSYNDLSDKPEMPTNFDITAIGNPVQLDGLQGGVPFSEIVVSGKNLIPYPYNITSGVYNGVTVIACQSVLHKRERVRERQYITHRFESALDCVERNPCSAEYSGGVDNKRADSADLI